MHEYRHSKDVNRKVALALSGGRVTASFRESLFEAAAREGVSINEFCLRAAAEKLKASCRDFSGLFSPNDIHDISGAQA